MFGIFYPENWGDDSIWRAWFFQNGCFNHQLFIVFSGGGGGGGWEWFKTYFLEYLSGRMSLWRCLDQNVCIVWDCKQVFWLFLSMPCAEGKGMFNASPSTAIYFGIYLRCLVALCHPARVLVEATWNNHSLTIDDLYAPECLHISHILGCPCALRFVLLWPNLPKNIKSLVRTLIQKTKNHVGWKQTCKFAGPVHHDTFCTESFFEGGKIALLFQDNCLIPCSLFLT